MSQDTLRLIILNILGWSCYAFADTLGKYLSSSYSVSQILLIASSIAGSVLISWIYLKQGWKGFTSPKLKYHLIRAAGVAGVSFCVMNAFSRIPLADFYGVTFSAPFLILIFLALVLKEPVGWHRWVAVGVGFLGVLILAGPEFKTLNVGYLYAAAATGLITFTSIIIRKIGKDEYLPLYGVYPPIFIALFNAPMALADFVPVAPFHVLLFGLYGAIILGGLLMTTYSIAKIHEMAIVAPFQYAQIVWGIIFGFFIFGDVPVATTYIGLILIVGAGLYTIYREHQNHKVLLQRRQ